jgi:hypothetical protein
MHGSSRFLGYQTERDKECFSQSRVGASDSHVVDLSTQKDDFPVDRTSVDTLFVRGVHDIEVVKDLVGVLFPQSTGFGVSLQGLDHW